MTQGNQNIEICPACNELYCVACSYTACRDCGVDTCGQESCIVECEIEDGCGERICHDCLTDHDCISEDEDEEEDEGM